MSRVLPILFNTDMVRAILDGRKTVTRRIVKHNVDAILNSPYHKEHPEVPDKALIEKLCRQPYQSGDILYVRETWKYYEKAARYGEAFHIEHRIAYKADENRREIQKSSEWFEGKWRPSIHMPQEAARIFLRVTDVRVEQLQDITEDQAIKEGISRLYDDLPDNEYEDWAKRTGIYPKQKSEWGYKNYLWHGNLGNCGTGNWKSDSWDYQYSSYENAVGSFSSLWNSTLKKSDIDCYSWDANPWVWVIKFERCEKPEGWCK